MNEVKRLGVGGKMKDLRKKAHMTQPELAEKLGVHETTIRRWEQERDKKGPDTAMIAKLAEIFGVNVEYLINDAESEEVSTTNENSLVYEWGGYEWGGTSKITLPNTPESRELFERLMMYVMKPTSQPVIS